MKSIKGKISKRDDVFKCDKCDKIFKSKDGHKSHLKNSQCNIENFSIIPANDEKVMFYKCNICGTSFLSKKLCLDHCNKVHMKNQKEVKELLRNNTTTASYKCDICEKKFNTEKYLKDHRVWHGEFNYECDICHKMFPSKSARSSHKIKHFPKTLVCRWNCGETFIDSNGRMNHERRNHYENNPLERSCDICGKPCSTEKLLKCHKKTHLNPSERTDEYKCSKCSEVFQTKEKVIEHRKLMHYDEKFRCSKCNKIFVLERNLILHMEKHESESSKRVPIQIAYIHAISVLLIRNIA